ncbi:MAG: ChaB family protein [Cyanobacteria bacterium SZAS LIN-5]|nr:ChaB family protein [Cyanobacteria bacterium SZAS LIN-5]
MPYVSIEDLPDPVKNSLPLHAQEIFKEAFNSAYHDHENDVDEVRAFKIAWGAVKRTYEKKAGKWVRKKRKGH